MAIVIGLPSPLRAQDCPAVNVWFVVDKSGSINWAELSDALGAITGALSEWSTELNQGVVWVGAGSFSEDYQTNCHFSALVDSLVVCVESISSTDGSTDIMNAMEMATYEFSTDIPRFAFGLNVIILCSDGIDMTRQPSLEQVEKHRAALKERVPGLSFFAIDISENRPPPPLSRQHNELLLTGYASDGVVVDSSDPRSLERLVEKIKKLANCQ